MMLLRKIAAVFRSLRSPDYRVFALANIPALITDWMQRVAVGYLAWDLTHSAGWLGTVAFVEYFPAMILSPFAGVVADRMNRRNFYILCQVLLAIQAFVGAALIWSGSMTIHYLVAVNLAFGTIKAFESTARASLIPGMVPITDVSTAIGFDSLTFNLARIVGPAIAGWVIVTWGPGPAFSVNILAFAAYVVALTRINPPPEFEMPKGKSVAGSLWEGLVYIVRDPGIGPAMMLLGMVSLTARATPNFTAGFAGEIFHRGADGQATLTSAMGIGAIAAGLYLTQRFGVKGLSKLMVQELFLLGLAMVAFVATDIFPVALVAMMVIGYSTVSNGAGSRMLTQNACVPEMRGRLASYYSVLQRGAGSLGALFMGFLADVIGLRGAFLIGGILGMLAAAWAMRRVPAMAAALEIDPVQRRS
jgi:MFS family permease